MSWQGTTLFPVLEHVFGSDNAGAPAEPKEAAKACEAAGHADVARYIAALDGRAYEDMLWLANIEIVNRDEVADQFFDRMDVIAEDNRLASNEAFYEELDCSESGYPNYDYDAAYGCK